MNFPADIEVAALPQDFYILRASVDGSTVWTTDESVEIQRIIAQTRFTGPGNPTGFVQVILPYSPDIWSYPVEVAEYNDALITEIRVRQYPQVFVIPPGTSVQFGITNNLGGEIVYTVYCRRVGSPVEQVPSRVPCGVIDFLRGDCVHGMD